MKILIDKIMEESAEIIENSHQMKDGSTKIAEGICRICLDNNLSPLISPCHCTGTGKHVHEACLKTWITLKYPDIRKSQCEVCKSAYKMKIVSVKKCSPKHVINDRFTYCCSIPILIAIILALGIILDIVAEFHLDFQNNKDYSIIILTFCVVPIIVSVVILGCALYKCLIFVSIKDWSFISNDEISV